MRGILLALLALLLVACGREIGPEAVAPVPSPPAAEQGIEPGRRIEVLARTEPTRRPVIPDDFPLGDGYPADGDAEPGPDLGLEEPHRTGPPLQLAPCGSAVPLPEHTDLLRAGWVGPEDGRARQLVTFASRHEAAAYVDSVVAAHRACPEHRLADGITGTRSTVIATELGEQGAAVSTQYTADGLVTPGLDTLHVLRVGLAVLVSVTGNEGGAGPDPEAAMAAQVAAGAEAVASVVSAMSALSILPTEPPFGPDGFLRVTLGLSGAALVALPGVRLSGPGRCRTFAADGVAGGLHARLGVGWLSPLADVGTPEGALVGSSLAELRSAYPEGTLDGTWFVAPVPGRDDRRYRFATDRQGRVIQVVLVLDDQPCVG